MLIILKNARILVEIFFSCANDEYYVNTLYTWHHLGAEDSLMSSIFYNDACQSPMMVL